MSLEILVLGATGRFGEVATLLLRRGHRVRALTRDPETPEALALEALGARMARGDYEIRQAHPPRPRSISWRTRSTPGICGRSIAASWRLALPSERRLQQVATSDVARFAVLALERAPELRGKRVELAGDELTGSEAATALSQASGRDIEYEELDPRELGSVSPGLVALFDWLARVGTGADVASLHRAYPEFGWQSFAQWAGARDWSWLGRRLPDAR